MVVVTRRLRSVVAPTKKVAKFPEEKVLSTSFGVVGRPFEDGEEDQGVYQEAHSDPTITFFKPFNQTISQPSSAVLSNIRSQSVIKNLTWIFGLAVAIFLVLVIYELALSYQLHPSAITPTPASGVFIKDNYRTASSFSNLPRLPS